jgi:hypothetical protein
MTNCASFLAVMVLTLPAPLCAGVRTMQAESTFNWVTFHEKNDRKWSRKTGLPVKEVRSLRLAAGIADDEPLNPIDYIDAKTLPNGRILFIIAAGSGHCLGVSVYVRRDKEFYEIWSAHEMPEGAGFCHPSLCRNPKAWATKANEIIVSVPMQSEAGEMGQCDSNTLLIYRWSGKTYELKGQRTVAAK